VTVRDKAKRAIVLDWRQEIAPFPSLITEQTCHHWSVKTPDLGDEICKLSLGGNAFED